MRELLGAIALMLVLAGCHARSDAPRPDSNDHSGNLWASELLLEADVEPLLLERGDTLHVRLTVTNEGATPVRRQFANGCVYGFGLWNDRGELVAPPPPICTMHAPTITWEPGEAVTGKFRWVWDNPEIGPGLYRVVAGFGERGEGVSASPVEIRLQ